jgi:hypothetical protein
VTKNRAGARRVVTTTTAAAVSVACVAQGVLLLGVTAGPAAAEDVPTVDIVSPGPSRAGQMTVTSDPATVVAHYSAAGLTPVTCVFEWGDGTESTSTPADGRCRDTHDYPGEGESASRPVTVRATFDHAGTTVEATDTVEMAVHPYFMVRLTSPQDGAVVANPVSVHFDTQSAMMRPLSAEIDWGDDETSSCGEHSCTHRYAAPGTYEVTAHAEWELLGTRLHWSDLVAVRVAPPPRATWGVVELPGGVTSNFAVRQGGPDGIIGGLWVHKGRSEFRSEEITGLTGGLGSAVLAATGSWRGTPGYTLELSVIDVAAGDQATVTIRDAKGDVVLDAGGDVVVSGGVNVLQTAD